MSKIGENEKAILKGDVYDQIGYGWMFKVLRGNCRETEVAPIVRIARQLSEMGRVIHRELELGLRNPEGVGGGRLCKKRRDLKSMGRFLTNREMYIYFKDCSVVKSLKLSGDIERHCISLEFAGGSVGNPMVRFFRKNSHST